jgi:hypothetical protein
MAKAKSNAAVAVAVVGAGSAITTNGHSPASIGELIAISKIWNRARRTRASGFPKDRSPSWPRASKPKASSSR